MKNNVIPQGAVLCSGGSYVGRGHARGGVWPGTVKSSLFGLRRIHYVVGKTSYNSNSFEALVNNGKCDKPPEKWIDKGREHKVPENAVRGGHKPDGTSLYIARSIPSIFRKRQCGYFENEAKEAVVSGSLWGPRRVSNYQILVQSIP